MKKDFGVKTWLHPMPVLMIATYNEDGSPNVMNAAWGGTGGEELLTVCIDNTHKTRANIEKRKALTDGKPDAEKIAPITFDPVAHVYRPLAAPIATAFKVGLEG